jgi:hypothetical protein
LFQKYFGKKVGAEAENFDQLGAVVAQTKNVRLRKTLLPRRKKINMAVFAYLTGLRPLDAQELEGIEGIDDGGQRPTAGRMPQPFPALVHVVAQVRPACRVTNSLVKNWGKILCVIVEAIIIFLLQCDKGCGSGLI